MRKGLTMPVYDETQFPAPLDPEQFEPDEYATALSGRNLAIQAVAKGILSRAEVIDQIKGIAREQGASESRSIELITTGSDGRFEKGPTSPVDVIVLLSRKVRDGVAKQMETELEATLAKSVEVTYLDAELEQRLDPTPIFSNVEVKNLADGPLMYFERNKARWALWPSRLIDAAPLIRDGDCLLDAARTQLYQEITENSRLILEVEKERRRNFAVTTRGTQEDPTKVGTNRMKGNRIVQFSLEDGMAFYDPSGHQTSFKHGPLRLVQAGLQIEAFQTMDSTVICNLPSPTIDKIFFLHDLGVIQANYTEMLEFAQLYRYFLWQYHRSEYAYRMEGATSVSFDPIQVRENLLAITRLEEQLRGK